MEIQPVRRIRAYCDEKRMERFMVKKFVFAFLAIISLVFILVRAVEANKMKYEDITGTWVNKETKKVVDIKYNKGFLYLDNKPLEIIDNQEGEKSRIETINKTEGVSYTFLLEKKDEYLLILCELNNAALKPIELIKHE